MSRLFLTFYGDDLTGSTDALEQLSLAGVRAVLFLQPPSIKQLSRFKNLEAVGVAGMTRALPPRALERELQPALTRLKRLGPRHVHYKVCSTFDSSPEVGSIGRVLDVASKIFSRPFVPLLVAAPDLGRYTVFGNHFARYGIGSAGAIYRLDRHPSISRHPVTPMTEADLRLHLAKQTRKRVALFDVLSLALPAARVQAAFAQLLQDKPEVVLFDALTPEHLERIGALLENYAHERRPLFSIGSSGIETALASRFSPSRRARATRAHKRPAPDRGSFNPGPLLVGSGSCSPVTAGQIEWALQHGFVEVAFGPHQAVQGVAALQRTAAVVAELLRTGRSVLVHTGRPQTRSTSPTKATPYSPKHLGTALGQVLRLTIEQSGVRRLCIAGGDTSSYAARALGVEALEAVAPLTPGAPLCRASAPGSPIDGLEVVFKGGQVGAEDYFAFVRSSQVAPGTPY